MNIFEATQEEMANLNQSPIHNLSEESVGRINYDIDVLGKRNFNRV